MYEHSIVGMRLTHRLLSLFAHRNSSEMEIEVDGSEILIPF